MNNLFTEAYNKANDNGKVYLTDLNKRKTILAIFNTNDNWFYVFTNENYVFYISQKYDCKSGNFGNYEYFISTIYNRI